MANDITTYPEHEKVRALKGQNQTIGEFIEWLQGPGQRVIAMWRPPFCTSCERPWVADTEAKDCCMACGAGEHHRSADVLVDGGESIPALLARYFGIDEKKLDDEKRQMLDRLRAMATVTVGPPAERDAVHHEAEKSCPECGHPMMKGPLRLGNSETLRMVDWWCADCHHAIDVAAEEAQP